MHIDHNPSKKLGEGGPRLDIAKPCKTMIWEDFFCLVDELGNEFK